MALTAKQVESAKGPVRLYDGRGLILAVTATGARSWLFRFTRNGRTRDAGLGSAADVSLAKARELAAQCRQWLVDGLDPVEQRRAERQPSTVPTFREFVDTFIGRKKSGWRNGKTERQFKQTLDKHAFKTIGPLHVDEITVAHVEKILTPIWEVIPVGADRVRSHIEAVLDAAIALQHRATENPARWRTIKNLFSRPRKVRKPVPHEALAYDQIPKLMNELRGRDTVVSKALQFTVLTACRTQEVIGATWGEIDLKAKVWTIPASRMKSERPHRVPLSREAIALLGSVPRERDNEFVFVGQRRGRGLTNIPMLRLMQSLHPGATVHGTARAGFRTWCSEQTSYAREVAEAALAHHVGDAAERSYARSDLFERRRALMRDWAKYCSTKK